MFCLFLLLLFGVCLALDCPELVCFNEKDKKHCVLFVLASCVCCFVASFVSPCFISRLFDVVRPALVVLFVSLLLFISIISFMLLRFALVSFFAFVLCLFIFACVCFFRVGCSFVSCLFCVCLFLWRWFVLRLFISLAFADIFHVLFISLVLAFCVGCFVCFTFLYSFYVTWFVSRRFFLSVFVSLFIFWRWSVSRLFFLSLFIYFFGTCELLTLFGVC